MAILRSSSIGFRLTSRLLSTQGASGGSKVPPQKPPSPPTSRVSAPPSSGVQNKAASGVYQSPEYFKHDQYTFYDYFVQMDKDRLPQPSNKKK